MPCPVSRYQAPLLLSRSMPAAFHSASSAMCVPLRSPRETNGACAASIFFSATTMSLPPPIFAGSLFGPISTKSLYITGKRLTPCALGEEFLLGGARVHEHDVGVAAPREVERLPGAERHDAHLDAGLLLEDRQQIAEQARLLGRRRRRDGDERVLRRARRARRARAAATRNRRRAITMAILLRGIVLLRRDCRLLEETVGAARARQGGPGAGTGSRRPGGAPGPGCA